MISQWNILEVFGFGFGVGFVAGTVLLLVLASMGKGKRK